MFFAKNWGNRGISTLTRPPLPYPHSSLSLIRAVKRNRPVYRAQIIWVSSCVNSTIYIRTCVFGDSCKSQWCFGTQHKQYWGNDNFDKHWKIEHPSKKDFCINFNSEVTTVQLGTYPVYRPWWFSDRSPPSLSFFFLPASPLCFPFLSSLVIGGGRALSRPRKGLWIVRAFFKSKSSWLSGRCQEQFFCPGKNCRWVFLAK